MLSFQSECDVESFLKRHEMAGRALRLRREAKGIFGFGQDETTFRSDLIGSLSAGASAFETLDVDSRFVVLQDGVRMTCFGGGPVHAGLTLNEAVKVLALDDGVVCKASMGPYRLHLEIRRVGDRVQLARAREVMVRLPQGGVRSMTLRDTEADRLGFSQYTGPAEGPECVEDSWSEFVRATDEYWRWVLFEFPNEADWLLEVPIFLEWRARTNR